MVEEQFYQVQFYRGWSLSREVWLVYVIYVINWITIYVYYSPTPLSWLSSLLLFLKIWRFLFIFSCDFDRENVVVEFLDSDLDDFAMGAPSSAKLKENKKMPDENVCR